LYCFPFSQSLWEWDYRDSRRQNSRTICQYSIQSHR